MKTVNIDFGHKVDDGDIRWLAATLPGLRHEDELVITMEAADAHQAERVYEMLTEGDFDYQPKTDDHGQVYVITARKRAPKH
ncbi:hypothetical protein ACP3TJ_08090 [Desulforudis sp. 1088]|uniref:hypothetical protein n=1 Tax=unclassified Candidatus Desulforudis TaxID=2635950 RepID=UPI0034730D46